MVNSMCARVPRAYPFSIGDSLDHQHLEVRAHHSIDAQCLRQSIDLVQVETSGPPGFAESLQRNIDADLVAKSKAVDHGAGKAIDPDLTAFDVVLFDAQIEECRDG